MKMPASKYGLILFILMMVYTMNSHSQNPSWMYWDPWNALIPSRFITAIEVDENGIKWIGTEPVCGGGICTDGGLAAFDGITWTVYDSLNSSLNSNFIGAVALDIDDVVWVGTRHGEVSSFDGTNWEAHPFPTKSNVAITGISSDLYGYIWVTTEGNGLYMYDGVDWDAYNSGNSILVDYLRSVEVGPDNAVWAGGIGDILFKYTGSDWNEFPLPEELYFTSTIAIDHENRIWVGSDGIFCRYYAGEWTVFDENITGIADTAIGYVFDITFDINGNTWIGHSEGLIKYDGSEWTTYLPSNSGMLSRHVMSLSADVLGNLWIGTADTGLIAYQEKGVVGISEIRNSILHNSYPNPFVQNINIQYELIEPAFIRLSIVDMMGRTVRLMKEDHQSNGIYNYVWDGRNNRGNRCQPGIYLLLLVSDDNISSQRIILQ